MMSATYSPEDNALRLSSTTRLDPEIYKRVKEAGFQYAPKQELFKAPMWTPAREDLLLELCGSIEDEDTSLVERAEDRSERFQDYSQKRLSEANANDKRAHDLAYQVGGQPILVNHHSERRARADQRRIHDWTHNAVSLWRTAAYWQQRAEGALRHAKYKGRPDVRARRIKGLEADLRKHERGLAEAKLSHTRWARLQDDDSIQRKDGVPMSFLDRAVWLAGHSNTTTMDIYLDLTHARITPEEAQAKTLANAASMEAWHQRWIDHLTLRLEYERAMLAGDGGTVADQTRPEKGGGCRCWASPQGGWSWIVKVNKVSVTVYDNWKNGGPNFTRTIPFDALKGVMTAVEVAEARVAGRLRDTADGVGFYLTT